MKNKLLKQFATAPFATMTRRNFVRMAGGCAGLSSLSLLSTMLNLKLTANVMADTNAGDYKAMVCLFLFGGNDSHNWLAPYEDSEYDNGETGGYVNIRRGVFGDSPEGVALRRFDDLPANDVEAGMSLKPVLASNGKRYGIHGYFNALRNETANGDPQGNPIDIGTEDFIRQMYNDGEVAFVSNVGTLIQPTTIQQYRQGLYRPVGIFSHSDEQRNWMTALPQTRSQNIGYLGRTADVLRSTCNLNAKIGMNIALNSINVAQTGTTSLPYVVTSGGAFLLEGYGNGSARDQILTKTTDSLLSSTYANLLESTYATSRRDAVDAAIEYNGATQGVTLMNESIWPNGGVQGQLKQVAKAILAHGANSPNGNTGLNQERQIFFVARGGFDNHSALIPNHRGSMPDIGRAIWLFGKEMREQGLMDAVTLFTASDFARTLGSNGNVGSDHAWGSNQLVMGGAQVQGGDVHGFYPDMSDKAAFLSDWSTDSRGRLLPSHSVDEYMEGILRWFGVPEGDLGTVLPNLGNFSSNPYGELNFMS